MLNTHIRDNLLAISTQPSARVYRTSAHNIPNNTETAIGFDSERFDTDTIHDVATNVERLTCKTAGKYAIWGHAEFVANATGQRWMSIRLNGATKIDLYRIAGHGTYPATMRCATDYALAVNDYVELTVFQDSGGAINISQIGSYSPEFAMQRLSD